MVLLWLYLSVMQIVGLIVPPHSNLCSQFYTYNFFEHYGAWYMNRSNAMCLPYSLHSFLRFAYARYIVDIEYIATKWGCNNAVFRRYYRMYYYFSRLGNLVPQYLQALCMLNNRRLYCVYHNGAQYIHHYYTDHTLIFTALFNIYKKVYLL